MQLTGLVAFALLALKVTAISPESGSDVEARDFSGESLNEFDVRTPDEEDLEARTDYNTNKCGKGAYWKHNKCYCHKHWLKYDASTKTCYKPLVCKGKNVKVEGYGHDQKCVCTLENQEYDEHKGCVCVEGYSLKYGTCVKDCAYGEKYDEEHKQCYTPCKGHYVKDEWSGYPPAHTCVCKKHGFEYDAHKGGCYYPCPAESTYDKHTGKCKCDKYGYIIKDNVCQAPCKGDGYFYKHDKCYCKDKDEVYDKTVGCKPRCPDDQKYNWHKKECECKDYKKILKDGVCIEPCKGDGYFYKHDKCYCKDKEEVYDETVGCKPRCREDQKYNWFKKECECKDHKKIIKNDVCVSPCIGYGVFYKNSKCYCKDKDYVYHEHVGCKKRCDGDAKYNWYKKECECKDGYKYEAGKGCVKTCKPPATLSYGQCVCDGGREYSWKKGCYCPWGEKYDESHKACYKPCHKPHQVIKWKHGHATCECERGYKPSRWGCEKKKHGGYY